MATPKAGDTVWVILYDGRVIEGYLDHIKETCAGTKYVVSTLDIVVTVDPRQILAVNNDA